MNCTQLQFTLQDSSRWSSRYSTPSCTVKLLCTVYSHTESRYRYSYATVYSSVSLYIKYWINLYNWVGDSFLIPPKQLVRYAVTAETSFSPPPLSRTLSPIPSQTARVSHTQPEDLTDSLSASQAVFSIGNIAIEALTECLTDSLSASQAVFGIYISLLKLSPSASQKA